MEALAQAATGKLPVLFCAHRADDINTALRLAAEFKLDARLGLAGEGYLLADAIATSKIPVFLHPPLLRAGTSMETLNVFTGSARVLGQKGVPVVLGSSFEGYVPKIRNIRSEAGAAAAAGWAREEVMAAITSRAASILGIDRGTIAVGKAADLALFDGDPLENATHATHTIIAGRVVYNRAEYLELPLARRGLSLSGASGPGCCLGW
jgi:imidazolonepropionase-like amidohydrolase